MEKRVLVAAEDTLDLRVYVGRIIHRWPFLLFLSLATAIITFVGSYLLPPVYEATAVLTIPGYATNEVYSANLLMSESIHKAVLTKPDIGADILDRITITADKDDKVTYSITVKANNPSQAVLEANTWAEEGIKWIKQKLQNSERAWMNRTKAELEATELELLQFLEVNGLSEYSLIDIRFFEGTYSPNEYVPVVFPEPLDLNASDRAELRILMRAQSNAAEMYAEALDRYSRHQMQLQVNGPMIINHAQIPDEAASPQFLSVMKNAALALVLTSAIGIFIILLWGWWKEPSIRTP
ncbi:MAG: hypothetical protein JW929_10710 [Anaerolineales bacterium]|nr:hypothetical protein [Anaerolineales bacterium]